MTDTNSGVDGEREAFEVRYPLWDGVYWDGVTYRVHDSYVNSYRADRYVGAWEAWQARASLAPTGFTAEDMATASAQRFRDGQEAAESVQPAPAQDGYEHRHAIMEGERNASLDGYRRVVYLTRAEERIYETGFTNGWDRSAARTQAPAAAVERIVHLRADREKRIYVAGPMTGLPEYNFPAFNAAAEALRADGWHVENPAEHGHVEGAGWADYLRYDLSRVATCGAVYLLPGWPKSKGATLEVHVAGVLGLQIILADGAEPVQ